MIHSFEIKDPAKSHIKYLDKVGSLSTPRTFTFKPGLNIIFGKNGAGKSTLLTMISDLLHCNQGGYSCVTQESIRSLGRVFDKNTIKDVLEAADIKHDGQCVRYINPRRKVGLVGDGAGFDDDFFTQGVSACMTKGSSGELTMNQINKLIFEVSETIVPEKEWKAGKIKEQEWNDKNKWQKSDYERQVLIENYISGNSEKGQLTVIFDEIDLSLDIPLQLAVWRFIRALSTDHQVIVASHSLFSLNIPEANYIELNPELKYMEQCQKAVTCLAGWAAEKNTMEPIYANVARVKEKLKKEKNE